MNLKTHFDPEKYKTQTDFFEIEKMKIYVAVNHDDFIFAFLGKI